MRIFAAYWFNCFGTLGSPSMLFAAAKRRFSSMSCSLMRKAPGSSKLGFDGSSMKGVAALRKIVTPVSSLCRSTQLRKKSSMLYSMPRTTISELGSVRVKVSCLQPRNRPRALGVSVLTSLRIMSQPVLRLAEGPESLKSSTYTTKNNFSSSCQKQERHGRSSLKPTLARSLAQCSSQCPPLSG